MSNKPRKKKKKSSKHNSAYRPIEAFDNYAQFEKSIDDIIELLNAQLATITSHDDEITIIKNHLIHHFGNNPRTTLKIRDIRLSLEAIAEREGAYIT